MLSQIPSCAQPHMAHGLWAEHACQSTPLASGEMDEGRMPLRAGELGKAEG